MKDTLHYRNNVLSADWLRSNWLCFLFIAFGILFRLIWVNDMEWKYDEKWMYNTSQTYAQTHHWDAVGMESGGGIVNPGLSSAIFTAMAYVVHSPTAMAAMVQWINVLAILFFLMFIIIKVEKEEKDTWLWGLALASVSPLAVLFSRKIWAQDVLPIFTFLVVMAHANRNKAWGAFLWGLFGALIGQLHMSGFYFAAGLAIFSFIHDYRNKYSFKWVFWLLGSAIGGLGLIPWLLYLSTHHQPSNFALWHIYQFNFYIFWFIDAHGLNTMYSLHGAFWDFVKQPFMGGHPTYLVGVLHIALVAMGIYTVIRLFGYPKNLVLWIKQKQLFAKLFDNITSTNFYLLTILLGLGIILNFSCIVLYPHYLIVVFPFSYIFMAKIFKYKKKLFVGFISLQLLLTASFLIYIHTHDGAKEGDYGITYRAQIRTP